MLWTIHIIQNGYRFSLKSYILRIRGCYDIGKHLSVRSTDAEFSKVAYDQRHEQNNKIVL